MTDTTFGGHDYVALAKGFGIAGHEVRTIAECQEALRTRATDTPTLIAARVDPTAYQLG